MALVSNNIVKMEWERTGWLAKKPKGSKKSDTGVFIFGSKVYKSTNKGNITVFFNTDTAWIWASDPHTAMEDFWNASDLKSWYNDGNGGYAFPINWEEYVPVIEVGGDECDTSILEEYGITEFKSDIEARLQDLKPFANEFDYKGNAIVD